MKGQGGGGTAKGGGKSRSGGGSVAITTTKKRETVAINDSLLVLRSALFTPSGADKNVIQGIAPAFLKYDRNDLAVDIEFQCKLSSSETNFCLDTIKRHMEERYDDSGYGWDDEDKRMEPDEDGKRFLIVRERVVENEESTSRKPVKGNILGFVHFRFTVQGKNPHQSSPLRTS